jgi:uncharacterized protein (TIGR02594 family)
LGNVRATVSSVKTNGIPEVLSYTDFYPHGGILPGRNYVSSNAYRYDYQGQEKDPETNWSNFELRMYDANLGRWMSPDPYGEFHSPYLAMGNNPVSTIDPDGGKTVAMAPEPPPEPEYDGRQDDWLIERRDAIAEGGGYGNRSVSFDFTRVTDADGEVTWIPGAISDIDFVSVGYELPYGQLGIAINAVQAYYKGSNDPLLSDAIKIANILIEGKVLADEVEDKNANSPWINVAESQIGISELTGNNDGKDVVKYLKSAGLNAGDPWCGAFVNWTLQQVNIKGVENSGRALNWRKFENTIDKPAYGSIGTLERPGGGHVGFVVGADKERPGWVIMLGGNQSDKVSLRSYPTNIMKFNYPKGFTPSYVLPSISKIPRGIRMQ